ncbi:YadA-like family protein [Edwardsiella piscicida]|uniref:YadA-like family protein n=1 Tax=Edwardsiella piscicida TaxID=1263550 RepID=UPI00370D1573
MKKNIIASAISASLFIMTCQAFAAAPERGDITLEGVENRKWEDPITISESLNTLEQHIIPKINQADTKASVAETKAEANTQALATLQTSLGGLNGVFANLSNAFSATGEDGSGPSSLETFLGLPSVKRLIDRVDDDMVDAKADINGLRTAVRAADTKASTADNKADTNAEALTTLQTSLGGLNGVFANLSGAFSATGEDGSGPSSLEEFLKLPAVKEQLASVNTATTEAKAEIDTLKTALQATDTKASTADNKADTNAEALTTLQTNLSGLNGVFANLSGAFSATGEDGSGPSSLEEFLKLPAVKEQLASVNTATTETKAEIGALKTALQAAFIDSAADDGAVTPSAFTTYINDLKQAIDEGNTANLQRLVTQLQRDFTLTPSEEGTPANSGLSRVLQGVHDAGQEATDAKLQVTQAASDGKIQALANAINARLDTIDPSEGSPLDQRVTTLESELSQGLKSYTETIANAEAKVQAERTLNAAIGYTDLRQELTQAWQDTAQRQINDLYREVDNNRKELRQTAAKTAALSGLFQPYGIGNVNVTAAMGGYKDEQAAAVGVGYRVNETFAAKAGIAFGSGSAAYNVGVNLEF